LMMQLGVAAGFTLLESKVSLPTIAKLEPSVLYGAGLYLLGSRVASGNAGKFMEQAGATLLTIGASRCVKTGSIRTAGTSDDDDSMPSMDDDDDDAEDDLND